jgi:hypothetical protein
MVQITRENKRKVYAYLLEEGVIVVKKVEKCNIKGFLERKPFGHLSAEPACLGAAEISEIEGSG